MSVPIIPVITGPTASGKTEISIEVAQLLNAEILSADSRQIYKYLDIGTAKPSPQQLSLVPHHFISILDPAESYTAGRYSQDAGRTILSLADAGKNALVAGGSGLYVKALADGVFQGPSADAALRASIEKDIETLGIDAVYAELLALDPDAALLVPKTNHPRVVRALEVCRLTGKPFTRLRTELMPAIPFGTVWIGLRWPRALLYDRINRRTLWMTENGFFEEVQSILRAGYAPALQSLQTVGYKEAFRHFAGELSLSDTISLIQQHTRNFAKRQITWFSKEKRIHWFDVASEAALHDLPGKIVAHYKASLP